MRKCSGGGETPPPELHQTEGARTIANVFSRVICNGWKIARSEFPTVAFNFATVGNHSALFIVYSARMTNQFMDSKTAAAQYGFSLCRLNQIAKERGVKPTTLGGIHLWTPLQVKKLKPKVNGRPRGSTNRKARK